MESPAKKEAKVTKENMVLLVPLAPRDLLEHLVLLVQMVNLVREVSRVCLDKKEMKDRGVSLDLLAQLVCRACRVHLVRKVKLETLVKWAHPVHLGPEDPLDLLELMALRDLLVALETLELLEKREMLVNQESRDFKETSALQDQEVNEVRRGKLVLLVLPDHLVLKVPLEMMVPKAALVQVVSPVTLVPQESLVLLV